MADLLLQCPKQVIYGTWWQSSPYSQLFWDGWSAEHLFLTPANLEAGDSEEIAQVDAFLLMFDLQCVGQLGAPVHCWLYQTAHKLGLFHHPLLKLFHGLLCCLLYFCVHLWFMANSICDFKQRGFKGIRRRIWVSGIFVCSFCNFGFSFFLFFSIDSFTGLVEHCA
jgi:hypothetical protein